MNIIFVTNFFNHHQRPLAEALYKETDGNYTFIETKPISADRLKLGWENQHTKYVRTCYNFEVENDEDRIQCAQQIELANVVMTGSAPEILIANRIKNKKLIYRWSERPFKKRSSLKRFVGEFLIGHLRNPINTPIYMLCSSAYTAYDYSKLGLFLNRTYKWGFFPETRHYESLDDLLKKKNKNTILWCGRFLDWKHPEDAIYVAKRLKEDRYDFKLKIAGCGDLEDIMVKNVKNNQLEKCVQFLGVLKTEEVRDEMEKAGIYLFTSDKQEGWGAVLNEAMNSGCAVVASHAIGAVPYLVEDCKNGYVYESGNKEMLYEKVKFLLENKLEQERLGKAAYYTIVNEWNAEEAAKRFVNLSEHILSGENYPDLYKSGPCSKAIRLKDKYKSKV